jgi:hypothetical protein
VNNEKGKWEAAWAFLDWDNLFRKSQNNFDQFKGTQPYILNDFAASAKLFKINF